jgi:hypothetical protein|tara:strand:- start:431 stop:1858 length:1428 start_codon:yes stop_codon:yes gene_type:complete
MSTVQYNFIFFICIFPVWALNFALELNLLLIIFAVFLIFLLVHNYIFKRLGKNENLFYFYLALICTYGIDNNLGLFSDLIVPNVRFFYPLNAYFVGLIFLSFFLIINFLLFKKLKLNGVVIIFVFIFSNFIYSIFFSDKNLSNFPDFSKDNISEKKDKITLIFVMDQMAGIQSDASKTDLGKKFDNNALTFSKKYNATIYNHIYTQCSMTFQSIPKLINFDTKTNCEDLESMNYIKKSKKFFNEYEILNNKLFDKFKDISVFQNYHMNFCNNKNVKKCNQYIQFKNYEYVSGFKDTSVSKIIGAWKHYGPISSNIIWRILLTFNLIDSYEQAGGEKGAILSSLKMIENDIYSENYDLIFIHSLSTHNPYAFNENCEYSGKRYINYSKKNFDEAIKGQNNDRVCILSFFDKFFERLKKNKILNKIEFIILSDHGTRLLPHEDSTFKTIFIHKKIQGKNKVVKNKSMLQNVFQRLMN